MVAQDGDEQRERAHRNDDALRAVRAARVCQRVITKNATDFEKIEDLRPFGWQAVSMPAAILERVFVSMHENNGQPTIMVVEDFEDNRVMLEQWLVIQGFRVVHACNGWEAVDVALRERPQLILMDLNLPLLDGTEAACLLRDDVELSEVPIIALTAYDSADSRADASDVGFDDYLTKPIDFLRLKQLINSLLNSQ